MRKRKSVQLLISLLVFLPSLWIEDQISVLEASEPSLQVIHDNGSGWMTTSTGWPASSAFGQANGRDTHETLP